MIQKTMEIKPELISWAITRSTKDEERLFAAFPALQSWLDETKQPTLKQLEKFAHATHTPIGMLFLSAPPDEPLPIADFRSQQNRIAHPSVNLLDSIYDCQRKQSWLRDFLQENGESPILAENRDLDDAAIIDKIRQLLDYRRIQRMSSTYEDLLSNIIRKLSDERFIVIRNGVVGYNTHRPLDREEFQGFALYDEYAPVIFINGKDYKSAQIFTALHELAHLFLNQSGLYGGYQHDTEQRCNKIAAEVLIPHATIVSEYVKADEENLARKYKVSTFVILVRAKQAGLIDDTYFEERWSELQDNIRPPTEEGGGDFYKNVSFKSGGNTFLQYIIASTLEGNTLHRDAYALTGLRDKTFYKYAEQLGYYE